MSSLAKQALEHARQRLAGQPRKAPTLAGAKISMPVSAPISTSFVPSGPISQHLFMEGRAWAVDMVASMRSEPAPKVVERLAGATAGKPESYAAGVYSVIKALSIAVHGESTDLSTKVPCGSGDLSTKPVRGTELEAKPCA